MAASSPQLPLGPYVDEVLSEPIQKRFSRFDAKRLDNLKAIEEREAEIAEWHAANDEKEDEEKEAECPIEPLEALGFCEDCLLYTSPSPRDGLLSRMPSSA